MPGHAWSEVCHDNTVTWLTRFQDSVMGETKYMMLAASSAWKGQVDHAKSRAAETVGLILWQNDDK